MMTKRHINCTHSNTNKRLKNDDATLVGFVCALPDIIMDIVTQYVPIESESNRIENHHSYTIACLDILLRCCDGQKRIIEAVLSMKNNPNTMSHTLVIGRAGTGKSFAIKCLTGLLGNTTKVVAPTGIAAESVDGQTIDSFLKSTNAQARRRLFALIIDEISMVSTQTISKIISHEIKRMIIFGDFKQLPPVIKKETRLVPSSKTYTRDRDASRASFTGPDPDTGGEFFFEHPTFKNCKVIELHKQYRQNPDETVLFDVLSEMRIGKQTSQLSRCAANRVGAYAKLNVQEKSKIIHLYCRNLEVNIHNERELNMLPYDAKRRSYAYSNAFRVRLNLDGIQVPYADDAISAELEHVRHELSTFYSSDIGKDYLYWYPTTSKNSMFSLSSVTGFDSAPTRTMPRFIIPRKAYVMMYNKISEHRLGRLSTWILSSFYDTVCEKVPSNIELCPISVKEVEKKLLPKASHVEIIVGMVVMVTANIPASKVMNGTIGKVTNVHKDHVIIDIAGYNGEKKGSDTRRVVPLHNKSTPVDVNSIVPKAKLSLVSIVSGMPLKPAWAITIHKCQGLTLHKAAVDIRTCWSPGLAYVAFSRVRTMAGLYIISSPGTTEWWKTPYIPTEWYRTLVPSHASPYRLLAKKCERCKKFYHETERIGTCC